MRLSATPLTNRENRHEQIRPAAAPRQVARRQAGAVATAVNTKDGLRWQVRRERGGLIRITERLAHTSHWTQT